ncbi:MAG: hypothetical protein C4348_01045 [Patescibacteria group bacterium]
MINFIFLLLSFLFLFLAFLYIYLKTRKEKLQREDFIFWFKFTNKIRFFNSKFLKYSRFLFRGLYLIFFNFYEKVLRRIKIEALKLESWAGNKIEKIRKTKEEKQNL